MSRCSHCQNTQGFVCGTCIECGWNDLDKRFHWIKVWIEDLHPLHDEEWLVQKHADSSRRAAQETGVRCTCNDFPGADEFCTAHKFQPCGAPLDADDVGKCERQKGHTGVCGLDPI